MKIFEKFLAAVKNVDFTWILWYNEYSKCVKVNWIKTEVYPDGSVFHETKNCAAANSARQDA